MKTILVTILLMSSEACARECEGTIDAMNNCVLDDTGKDHIAWIERETQFGLDAYARWANYPPELLYRLYRDLEVNVHVKTGGGDFAIQGTVAFTSIHSGKVNVYLDAWSAPWVFAEESGCLEQASVAHEVLHVARYLDIAILKDEYKEWQEETIENDGHPYSVFFGWGSAEYFARDKRTKENPLCQ